MNICFFFGLTILCCYKPWSWVTKVTQIKPKKHLKLTQVVSVVNFSSKTTTSNWTECAEFVLLICHGVNGDKVLLSNVNETKRLLVNTWKMQPKLTEHESAKDLCNMMFGYDIVVPIRSHHMINVPTIVDIIFKTSFHMMLEEKSNLRQQRRMEILCLFSQQLMNVFYLFSVIFRDTFS